MLSESLRTALESAIGRATGAPFAIARATAASGGCIHSSWVLESGKARYFAKTNDDRFAATFAAEADGLVALAGAGIRVPRPIAQGVAAGSAFLVLEHLALGRGPTAAFRELGRELARLHAHHGGEFRLASRQLHRAHPAVERAARVVDRVLADASGSRRSSRSPRGTGTAAIFSRSGSGSIDAVPGAARRTHARAVAAARRSVGRQRRRSSATARRSCSIRRCTTATREADLAMTELFGGFPPSFYDGYREVRPHRPRLPACGAISTTCTTCSTTSTCSAGGTRAGGTDDGARAFRLRLRTGRSWVPILPGASDNQGLAN